MSSLSSLGKRRILTASAVLWLLVVGAGVRELLLYADTPGESADPSSYWPGDTGLSRTPGRATAVVLVHPQCSCSRATIEELARILAHGGENVDVFILVYAPDEETREWVRSDLWHSASAIPGVRVLEDRNGREAQRFHALTSGQTLLYDPVGRLIFSGGITPLRGHAGDSIGRDAMLAGLRGEHVPCPRSPVFGCSLRGVTP